jgi:hypothetical protein
VRIVGGETIVCTHGTAGSRYEVQAGKRASAKAAADLVREEGCFRSRGIDGLLGSDGGAL